MSLSNRKEIELDDLFNAIEEDKDQINKGLEIYGEYLKLKNDSTVNSRNPEEKLKVLEEILKLECMEKKIVNKSHENERKRLDLKWTVLTECGFLYRKVGLFEKAVNSFEKANEINDKVSTIHFELSQCHIELGNLVEVKRSLEKTIELCGEFFHWQSFEQIIYFHFVVGNNLKCLEYIRKMFDRIEFCDFGERFLCLIEKFQPSMKILIEENFQIERKEKNFDDLKSKIEIFREKLFRNEKKRKRDENENEEKIRLGKICSFEEFGEFLLKKLVDREILFEKIDLKKFNEEEKQIETSTENSFSFQRKKRSFLPLNIDDYEKRRSARTSTRPNNDDSMIEQIRRIFSAEDFEEEIDSPETKNEISRKNSPNEFSPLEIDLKNFLDQFESKRTDLNVEFFELVEFFLENLAKNFDKIWQNGTQRVFTGLFEIISDFSQISTNEISRKFLEFSLNYVEIALGSMRIDSLDDSIERFSCFNRLKTKFKDFTKNFSYLQFYLYRMRSSLINEENIPIDDFLYRIFWASNFFYFLSDSEENSLIFLSQLEEIFPENLVVSVPNLTNFPRIDKISIQNEIFRLKTIKKSTIAKSSLSNELKTIVSMLNVADEEKKFFDLLKKFAEKFKILRRKIFEEKNFDEKILLKFFEILSNLSNENERFSENSPIENLFDRIFSQFVEIFSKFFELKLKKFEEKTVKTLKKLTLNLLERILKRKIFWNFPSTKILIFLYELAEKHDEQILVLFVRIVHEFFGKQEKCLIDNGELLEYFLIELIEIEHENFRKKFFSKKSEGKNDFSPKNFDSTEQKSRLTKFIDEVEQIVYCLYGLVLRKSKMKNLVDHRCSPIEFNLEKANLVFYCLCPKQIPGYEGRTSIITTETENLFQRFESMIEWNDEREENRLILIEQISRSSSSFHEDFSQENFFSFPMKNFKSNRSLFEKDLYYLFADYYLKISSKDSSNVETTKKKAEEYYLKDLCLNPSRFDSWAALTIIEFSKIEQIIESDEFDERIFNVYNLSSFYFHRSVSIDSNNHTLWMEFAEINYILQSFSSKFKEKFSKSFADRSVLLNLSKKSYEKANECTDNDQNKEEWTHLFMLAKIDEKLQPNILFPPLNNYLKALDVLHENKAVYPRKLGHQTSMSSSKGVLLGCYAVEMFYRVHSSSIKFLNRFKQEDEQFNVEQLEQLEKFLIKVQKRPFATSFYEKFNVPADGRAQNLIEKNFFPDEKSFNEEENFSNRWIKVYRRVFFLCIEGLYICISRYNRHYRGLYRLSNVFHTNHFFRNDFLSLQFLLGGTILELKNYPKIVGLFQERSKTNLFNGIWRIQPLEFERTGSFNSSMFKCTRLLIDLTVHSNHFSSLSIEILRQIIEKPQLEKKCLRENERKTLCHYAIQTLYRTIKKKLLNKTNQQIQDEFQDMMRNGLIFPDLFQVSIELYGLVKNFDEFFRKSRLNYLLELVFQRYRTMIQFSDNFGENPKGEQIFHFYSSKKLKNKTNRWKANPTMVQPSQVTTNQNQFEGLASFLFNQSLFNYD